MSFHAYITNVKEKTGKTPEDFKRLMETDGTLKPDMKATELVNWLKKKFDLGHGHAMAIWAMFKSKGWVKEPAKKKK